MGWYDTLVSAYDQIVETAEPLTTYIAEVGQSVADMTSAVIESVVTSDDIENAKNAATDAYNTAIDYLSDAYVYTASAIDNYISAERIHDEAMRLLEVNSAQTMIEDAITGISDAIDNLVGVVAPPPLPPPPPEYELIASDSAGKAVEEPSGTQVIKELSIPAGKQSGDYKVRMEFHTPYPGSVIADLVDQNDDRIWLDVVFTTPFTKEATFSRDNLTTLKVRRHESGNLPLTSTTFELYWKPPPAPPPEEIGDLGLIDYVAPAVTDALAAMQALLAEEEAAAAAAAAAGGIELRPATKEEWLQNFADWWTGITTPKTDIAFVTWYHDVITEAGVTALDFIVPMNAIHKLIYGQSLYTDEPDEMTTFDYIEIAVFVLITVTAAYATLKPLVGADKLSTATTKGVKGSLDTYAAADFEAGGKGIRLMEAALENPATRGKTIYELADFAISKPAKAYKYYMNAGESKKLQWIRGLYETPEGAKVGGLFLNEAFREVPMWLKFIKGAPKALQTMIIAGIFVWGSSFMVVHMRKEAPEPPRIAKYEAYELGQYDIAREGNELYEAIGSSLDEMWFSKLVERMPEFKTWLNTVRTSQRGDYEIEKKLLDGLLPMKAKVIVTVKPEGVYVYFNGVPQYVKGSWTFEKETGDYLIEAKKEGYETQKVEVTLVEGDNPLISFELKEGAAKMGEITLDCSPQAEIWIKGTNSGWLTPHTFTFAPGTYGGEFKRAGYYTRPFTMYIGEGVNDPISLVLTPTAPTEREETTGYVSFYTKPMGAYVFIDGIVCKYPTPTGVDLPPGTHSILIRARDYTEVTDSIDVVAGETYRREYTLELLPPVVPPVVEKVWNVTVITIPEGARVYIDDALWTYPTPTVIPLLGATYIFRFEKSGYYPAEFEIPIPG